jgi:succinyl-CoA:acetate CoA-transferase
MTTHLPFKRITAAEAAQLVKHDEVIACSGFTFSGYPKVIPKEIARRGRELHAQGQEFKLSLYTGASVGDELDGEWARSNIMKMRVPYQSCAELRDKINSGEIEFMDYHLSTIPDYVRNGYLRRPDWAIAEAVDVTPDGKVYLTTSGGATASFLQNAKNILIEWNTSLPQELKGIHDVYTGGLGESGLAKHIPLFRASDRIGTPYVQVDPRRIVGIVETQASDKSSSFREPDPVSRKIAENILDFLKSERKKGRLPKDSPYQSGVGNVANAVLATIARDPLFDPITLYTEVVQDSVFDLIGNDKLLCASTCALTFSPEGQRTFFSDLNRLKQYFILRQQDISNSPEVIHRLGLICMNTALEFDIFGNVNSTHVLGSKLMNGIGGSADFTRNGYLNFFMSPSVSKGGCISNVVPLVSHMDHSEHSTHIFVTDQGLADVRGLSPIQRARAIIENCAHPDYKPILKEYLKVGERAQVGHHIPIDLECAFGMHLNFKRHGTMLINDGSELAPPSQVAARELVFS